MSWRTDPTFAAHGGESLLALSVSSGWMSSCTDCTVPSCTPPGTDSRVVVAPVCFTARRG